MIRKFYKPSILALLFTTVPAYTDPLTTRSTNAYGIPGNLIDMPTAETAPEGQLTMSTSYGAHSLRATASFQVTDRLSVALRYTGIDGLNPNGVPYDGTYYDRSFDLQFSLLDETRFRPAVAIGMRDFIGTGIYGAEYIVATKSIGDKLRLTGGLGWGRLGSYGAFGKTGNRPDDLIGQGGAPSYDRVFRGDIAAFAGFSYALTDRLTFMAEYSSDDYSHEERDGLIKHESPFNFGASYQFNDNLGIKAYALHGKEFGISLNFGVNVLEPAFPGSTEEAPVPVAVRPAGTARDLGWARNTGQRQTVQNNLKSSLAREGIQLHALDLQDRSVHAVIRNERYDMRAQAIGRTARIMTRVLPASVERITLTFMAEQDIPSSSVTVNRSDLERFEHAPADAMRQVVAFSDPAGLPRPENVMEDAYPRLSWSFGPYANLDLFDPEEPAKIYGGLRATADYTFAPGWLISGSTSIKLFGNLNPDDPPVAPKVPIVRSDAAVYQDRDTPVLDYLTIEKFSRPAKDFYSRLTVGYLENMYAGISGEVLWKPVDSRLALGAELNYVHPRDYDQGFGLRSRNTPGGEIPEFNGHLSAYYDFGNGFHGQVDAGRYLAGDWGATVAVDRVFANGWRIGAYVTKTDLSSEEFGEGSFDKGIRISIPLSWAIRQPTKWKVDTKLQSLSRDGGARLDINNRLYDMIRPTHKPDVVKSWGTFWR